MNVAAILGSLDPSFGEDDAHFESTLIFDTTSCLGSVFIFHTRGLSATNFTNKQKHASF